MGCGASVNPPRRCTPEELQELCQNGCKEMEILTVSAAMEKPEEIVVPPPDCVNDQRENAQKLRDAAKAAVDKIESLTENDMAQNMVGDTEGKGMIGSVMGFMAKAADGVAELTGKGAGMVVSTSLNGFAAALDKAVEAIEKPFTEVGRDIVERKKTDLIGIYAAYINQYNHSDPVSLVRGADPYGAAEYQAVPPDSISKALTDVALQPLAEQMLPIVQSEIDEHAVTKAWDVLIETTNKAHDKISQYAQLEGYGIKKIQLDINTYIVEQSIRALGDQMGKVESEVRQNSAGKSRQPQTFAAVFSGTELMDTHYNNRGK
eukprot:CAMPEP_0172855676 /NCGR_PEP_ID=MMETSP1075-20121228/62265_1 /TAXON_ID=2916 /ORGANISM="Ceratium fusus, Strain PA161109" /LENGTH=318 /DNA_ID=CAMNT_0013702687 /DNA_START=56 /DNA_END=1012 /DNA_ORIENTATION=+